MRTWVNGREALNMPPLLPNVNLVGMIEITCMVDRGVIVWEVSGERLINAASFIV
jgi:hypothetical protein